MAGPRSELNAGTGKGAAYFPRGLDEALRIMADGPVLPYAGGTDLMVKYRRPPGCAPGFDRPVLFIGGLAELCRIVPESGGGLRIGACATIAGLLRRPDVPELLRLAAADMASPAIRAHATLGGNVVNASPAGDCLPPLYALDARMVLRSVRGERSLPIGEFIAGPGKTRIEPDELLIAIDLPPPPDGARFVYRKVGTRKAQTLAKVSIAALFRAGSAAGGFAEVRIALGAVAPTVYRSPELERRLAAAPTETLWAAAAAYGEAVSPIDDQRSTAAYRRRTAAMLVEWAAGSARFS